jgi:hypothetical protein
MGTWLLHSARAKGWTSGGALLQGSTLQASDAALCQGSPVWAYGAPLCQA